ncbi:hypothetical protein E2C01_065959 [Portunus trituberculatus]|uniref:Uncharacterized protein n=1 Tax=Portunus trituberculatus TaxID=210409 RepID=A0A5B7HT93_PORTR|nr:hypothetical protein [Portunus trituberculatus]
MTDGPWAFPAALHCSGDIEGRNWRRCLAPLLS